MGSSFLRNTFKIISVLFCFICFVSITTKETLAQTGEYKCKRDSTTTACVPCRPNPNQPEDINGCATGEVCTDPTQQGSAEDACNLVGLAGSCPGNGTQLANFSALTCGAATTPPPPPPPACATHPNGTWQCKAGTQCGGLQDPAYGCPNGNVCCQITAPPPPPGSTLPQNAIPKPYIPCSDVRNNEFHSLRPYQASPCNQNIIDTALYCSNDIIVNDTFNSSKNEATGCTPDLDKGVLVCDFSKQRSVDLLIDLRNAKLPIAGNTDDVRNFSNPGEKSDKINDPQKVNEYISWYLNGVNNRAEYPFPADTEDKSIFGTNISGHSYIVDLSGPLNKLLPRRIQEGARIKQAEDAAKSDAPGATANIRHNQIVGCTKTFGIPIPILGISYELPVPCDIGGADAKRLAGGIGVSGWSLPQNQPPKEEDYNNFSDYYKAYKEWRGNICIRPKDIPVLKNAVPDFLQEALFCANDPTDFFGIDDYISELFPYLPYSSTEDRVGDFRVEQNPPVQPQGSDPHGGEIAITNEQMTGKTYQNLYFPHMQENDELSDLLQTTYVPQGIQKNGVANLSLFTAGKYCEVRQTRSNPGDYLFGQELTTTLSYNARFQCEFALPPNPPTSSCTNASQSCHAVECSPFDPGCTCLDPNTPATCTKEVCSSNAKCYPNGYSCSDTWSGDCGAGYKCADNCTEPKISSCTITTTHAIPTYTETPYADSLWSRLVAGPMSAFKKFFPKFGIGSPITQLADIPALASSSYSSANTSTQVFAGAPSGQKPGTQAEIFFPHLGGIHQYFLRCLQQMIRPSGLGVGCDTEDLTSGGITSVLGDPIKISTDDRRHVSPWITIDSKGTPHIVFSRWDATDSGPESVMYSTGSSAEPISGTHGGGAVPVIAIDKNDKLHVVYEADDKIYYQQASLNSGSATWTPAELVSDEGTSHGPHIALDDGGNAHIVWISTSCGQYNVFYRVRNASGGFSNVNGVNQNCGVYHTNPKVAVTSDNKVHVTYTAGDPLETYYTRFESGNWTSPKNISNTPDDHSRNPSLTTDGANTIFVAWEEGINANNHDIVLSSSSDSGSNWSSPLNISANPGLSTGVSVSFSSTTNRVYVVWGDDTNAIGVDPEIWYAEYSASSNTSSQPQQISFLDKQQESQSPVVATGAGKIGIVWQDKESGKWQIYYLGGVIGLGPTTGGNPPVGQCTQSDSEIQTRINTTWGLPPPDPGAVQTLKSKISTGYGRDITTALLNGERKATAKGFDVIQYLSTAWLWSESQGQWPDPYSIYCPGTGSNVSDFCTANVFQIAGYQASEPDKNYKQTFETLYGNDPNTVTNILNTVINNSNQASRSSWSYQSNNPDIRNSSGLARFMGQWTSVTTNDFGTSGRDLVRASRNDQNDRKQFFSFMVGKDPAMVAALNSGKGGGGVSNVDLVRALKLIGSNGCSTAGGYPYVCAAWRQRLSNMIYALWSLDCGK